LPFRISPYIHWTNQTAPLIKNGSIAVKNLVELPL
jgi:hypothetical protein